MQKNPPSVTSELVPDSGSAPRSPSSNVRPTQEWCRGQPLICLGPPLLKVITLLVGKGRCFCGTRKKCKGQRERRPQERRQIHGPAEATSVHSSGCCWLKLRIRVWRSPSSHSRFGSISCCQNTGCPPGTGPHRGRAWVNPRWGRCPAFLRYLLPWSQPVASWTLDLSIVEKCGQDRLIE